MTANSIWVTGDNRRLTVQQMSNDHLKNARNLLQRRLPKLQERVEGCFSYYPCCQGDMTQYYSEQEWDHNIDRAQSKLDKVEFWIKNFQEEIDLRKAQNQEMYTKRALDIAIEDIRRIAGRRGNQRKALYKLAYFLEGYIDG